MAAGALSQEDLPENAGSRADELVTIATSIDVPRHGVAVRTGLDPALVTALTRVLTILHGTPTGRAVLEGFDETARFDALAPDDLAPVVALRALLDHGSR